MVDPTHLAGVVKIEGGPIETMHCFRGSSTAAHTGRPGTAVYERSLLAQIIIRTKSLIMCENNWVNTYGNFLCTYPNHRTF